mmetsp:Transcript_30010/g.75159  ORF Transcript_30010/g.75159 Transcript_30010/m.75159 type:complete len:206 (+) Transcript_30010:203-820(+)
MSFLNRERHVPLGAAFFGAIHPEGGSSDLRVLRRRHAAKRGQTGQTNAAVDSPAAAAAAPAASEPRQTLPEFPLPPVAPSFLGKVIVGSIVVARVEPADLPRSSPRPAPLLRPRATTPDRGWSDVIRLVHGAAHPRCACVAPPGHVGACVIHRTDSTADPHHSDGVADPGRGYPPPLKPGGHVLSKHGGSNGDDDGHAGQHHCLP